MVLLSAEGVRESLQLRRRILCSVQFSSSLRTLLTSLYFLSPNIHDTRQYLFHRCFLLLPGSSVPAGPVPVLAVMFPTRKVLRNAQGAPSVFVTLSITECIHCYLRQSTSSIASALGCAAPQESRIAMCSEIKPTPNKNRLRPLRKKLPIRVLTPKKGRKREVNV